MMIVNQAQVMRCYVIIVVTHWPTLRHSFQHGVVWGAN